MLAKHTLVCAERIGLVQIVGIERPAIVIGSILVDLENIVTTAVLDKVNH